MANVKKLDMAEFENLKKSGGLILVDFWAAWCGPCRTMTPIFEELSSDKDLQKIQFYSCDADANEELVTLFGVQGIPAFFLINLPGNDQFDPKTDIAGEYVGVKAKAVFKESLQQDLAKV